MRGMETVGAPSFTPDLKLDEAGIRWDVQTAIRHGFFSINSSGDWALSFEERKRVLEIMCDEAKGKILVGLMSYQGVGSWKQMIELLQHAEKVGVSHAMIYYPSWFYPESLEEIYQRTREVCEAANLGIVLWATAADDQYRFHPSSVPIELYDRIVDIPNVMAMKVGFPEPGTVYEMYSRYASKIQVNIGHPTLLGMYPTLAKKYSPQWAGTGLWEYWQSPEKPYMVEMFDHFLNGRFEQAMSIYWFLVKSNTLGVYGGHEQFNIGTVDTGHGFLDWTNTKYVQWSVGGNGGPVRLPARPMSRRVMGMRKAMLKSIGITPREPDEEFFVGRVNFDQAKTAA